MDQLHNNLSMPLKQPVIPTFLFKAMLEKNRFNVAKEKSYWDLNKYV